MKKLSLVSAFIFALAAPAMADPAAGMWKTKADDNGNFGHVKIAPCGAKVCGVLVKSFDGAGKPLASDNIGRKIIWNMVPEGDGSYSKGKVWAPDRDKTYRAKMTLSGNKLAVSGCVMGGLVCRASDWTRVK